MSCRSFCGSLASSASRWSPCLLGGSPWWRELGWCGSGTGLLNKLVFCILLIYGVLVLLHLLAGRGGEGKKLFSADSCGSGGCRGGFVDLAQWRGAGQWWMQPSSLLPRWKKTGWASEAASFNKRCLLPLGSAPALLQWRSSTSTLILLAGRGGEGEEKSGVVLCEAGIGRGARFLLLLRATFGCAGLPLWSWFVLAFERGAGRRLLSVSGRLPWWKPMQGPLGASSYIKRCHLFIEHGLRWFLLHLAGRGGEGWKKSNYSFLALVEGILLHLRAPHAVALFAVAYHGQKGGQSATSMAEAFSTRR